MTWFGFPNFDVTEVEQLMHAGKVFSYVSMGVPSEIDCVLQHRGNGGRDTEIERGQASKFEERGFHMVRWRCYVCLSL